MDKLQQHIVDELHVKPEIDPAAETREIIDFLKDYVKKMILLKFCPRYFGRAGLDAAR